MTTPEPTPYDTSNALLAGGPAQLVTSEVMTATGKLAAVTIRTQSTTLTAFLSRDDLKMWAEILQNQATQMSGLMVVPAGTALPGGLVAQR